jgi:hypothetical protein
MHMRKLLVTVALTAGLALVATPALAAGSAHFIKNATSASLSGSSLVVTFKEAGLSSGSTETITIDADALVTYECVNGGSKNPSASNKTSRQTHESTSGEFSADKNGNVVGSLTLLVPTAESIGFSCPPGQVTTLVSVTYSNVEITDEDSGATTSVSGTFTYTNPSAP